MSTENSDHYKEHSGVEIHGFRISDATVPDRIGSGVAELIWIGYGGIEGRWMTADEAKQVASELTKIVAAHEKRTT